MAIESLQSAESIACGRILRATEVLRKEYVDAPVRREWRILCR